MPQEFKGARAFLMIPPAIAEDEDLLKNAKSLILLGYIVSSLTMTGKFYMSNNAIAKKLHVSRRTAIRYVNLLEEKNLIISEHVVDPNTQEIKRRNILAGSGLLPFLEIV